MREIKCDLTDVPASIFDREADARHFDSIHDIEFLQSLSFFQYLLKGRNEPVCSARTKG